MTAYAVLASLRSEGITGPPTVYRALRRLIETGLVHRLESINAYVACSQTHDHQTAAVFAICQKCGRVEELTEPSIMQRLTAAAHAQRFQLDEAVIELKGTCGTCARSEFVA